MELSLSIHSNIDRDIERASRDNEPEKVRVLSFSLDKATMSIESWVLQSGGSMIQSGGADLQCAIPADHLDELMKILEQFQETTEASVACGVGASADEAAIALKVARKRGGEPAVVLWTPEIAKELEEDDDDELGPIFQDEEDDLEAPHDEKIKKAEPFGADDLHRPKGEATKVEQGTVRPSDAEPSAPSPVSPPSAPSAEEDQAQGQEQPQNLMQAVGEVLQNVKQQLPSLEGLKKENPKAYESILAMTQAVIALAQKLSGGQEAQGQQAAPAQPVQKSESDAIEDFFKNSTFSNWVHPDMEREEDEVHRVAGDLGVHPDHIKQAIGQAKLGPLDRKTLDDGGLDNYSGEPGMKFKTAARYSSEYGRDWKRIARGYKTNSAMPAPVVIHQEGKTPTLLGGNTRIMIGYAMNVPMQALHVHLKNAGGGIQKSEVDAQIVMGIKKESAEHPDVPMETIKQLVADHLKEDPEYYNKEEKIELDPSQVPPEGAKLDKMRLPEQKPPPAHHHLNLPVGSTKDRKVKVVTASGEEKWVQVAAGQILSQSGHSISSRNPGGK